MVTALVVSTFDVSRAHQSRIRDISSGIGICVAVLFAGILCVGGMVVMPVNVLSTACTQFAIRKTPLTYKISVGCRSTESGG